MVGPLIKTVSVSQTQYGSALVIISENEESTRRLIKEMKICSLISIQIEVMPNRMQWNITLRLSNFQNDELEFILPKAVLNKMQDDILTNKSIQKVYCGYITSEREIQILFPEINNFNLI